MNTLDSTFVCAVHNVPFIGHTADSGGAAWSCPHPHDAVNRAIFKPRTKRLPHPWKVERELNDGAWYRNKPAGIMVIVSGAIEKDERRWLHVSVSRPDRIPSHLDMASIKDAFIGPEVYAYAVYPPRSKYVNLHPTCLHLWACLDGPRLPEFSEIVGGVRTI